MIWLTWRQARVPALAAALILLAVLSAVAFTWPSLTDAARVSGFAACHGDCEAAAGEFSALVATRTAILVYYAGTALLLLLPALAGVFWGAPLVARELESGTFRMVWSQSVPARRWLAVKLAGVGGGVVLLTAATSTALTVWAGEIDRAYANRVEPVIFAARGVVPVGNAALALIAGVLLGLLLRRSLPAMAVTLLVVAAVQLAVPVTVRPLLADPVTTVSALDLTAESGLSLSVDERDGSVEALVDPGVTGSWVLGNRVLTAGGEEFTGPMDPARCGPEAAHGACLTWLGEQGLRHEVTHVPASRFWALQWREFGILALLTGVLSWFCLLRIRRRNRGAEAALTAVW
ncbi:transporter [Actinoplanes capillaceus]|uniref:Transporter n=1 Tax=Actinoplanes campanulatus TaxID=113559 RepID=A0ABQ3WE17_9ACTN|nr:hypothetical protein [Actinoplanes capillaceus]GID45267.1 transporter [Actinoplanes capillaceus]